MLEKQTVPLFGEERTIRIYLPDDYPLSNKLYPVLYMHDGQNVFEDDEAIGGVALGLHHYLAENKLELIVVAIDQNTTCQERFHEYCPWINGEFSQKLLGNSSRTGGKGKEYTDFIVNDLKPFIDRKYRTLEKETYIAGISLGGLISTYAACTYPQIFKKVACLSSAFYRNQEEMEKLLKNTQLSSVEFYLDCGTREAGQNHEVSELFLSSNQEIAAILKTELHIITEAEHNYTNFKERLPALISFFIKD